MSRHALAVTCLAAIVSVGCSAPSPRPETIKFSQVSTVAGTGAAGAVDGTGNDVRLNRPHGLSITADGAITFADRGNNQIRQLRTDGSVVTLAGVTKAGFADGSATSAAFNEPIAIAVDRAGAIYVADRNNHRIRKIRTDGTVTTVAGDGKSGFVNGSGGAARFNQPYGVALNETQNALYVADYLNHAIRGRSSSRVTSRHFDHGNGTLAFTSKLFRFG